jgi:hypothetical protein
MTLVEVEDYNFEMTFVEEEYHHMKEVERLRMD